MRLAKTFFARRFLYPADKAAHSKPIIMPKGLPEGGQTFRLIADARSIQNPPSKTLQLQYSPQSRRTQGLVKQEVKNCEIVTIFHPFQALIPLFYRKRAAKSTCLQ